MPGPHFQGAKLPIEVSALIGPGEARAEGLYIPSGDPSQQLLLQPSLPWGLLGLWTFLSWHLLDSMPY